MAAYAVTQSPYATDADKELVERVVCNGESFELGIGREFKEHCEKWYRQYRGFSRLRSAWIASPPDRDALLYDAKKQWGAQLHIPLSFRTIETVVPAAISQRPRMLYFPRLQKWADNVANVRVLIDQQQDQIDIDLPFQAVMRSGRIYGLGVGKCLWRKEYAMRRRAKRTKFGGNLLNGVFQPKYQLGDTKPELVFDDPDFEDVDVFDFMWDPYGADIRTCGWVIHRVWRSTEAVLGMMRSGQWKTDSVKALLASGREEDYVRSIGNGQKYDEVWQARMEASGFSSAQFSRTGMRGEQVHEVWEWHDGQQVLTVLDRTLAVVDGENPCVGEKPFMTYRPTPLQKQMIGIGDLEPLEHLQKDLDTLRSARADARTLALAVGWAYDSGAVDEEDIVFGPNMAIEVRNASPRDAIMPLQRPEVPGIAFKDEEVIRTDFDAVSGINDALNPQAGPSAGTATEAQLVQAALSRRIELGSRRFEIEVVRRAARCFLYLDQRMILANREMLLPGEGMTPEQAAEHGEWRKFEVGPGGLMGDFAIRPEGGSMAARNVPQDRQDAQAFFGMAAQNPHIDARRATLRGLELMGVDDPAGWLKKSDPPVPPMALEVLQKMGVDPRVIQFAIAQAQRQDPTLPPDGGPDQQQMNQAMGADQPVAA